MDLKPGEIVGKRYKIVRELGEGRFGKTYLAKDLNLPTEPSRVVKEITPFYEDENEKEKEKEGFNREADALYDLGLHPQIPQLYEGFQANEKYYLVQEYIEGHDLDKEIIKGKPWSENDVINLLCEILEIIKFVHQQNVEGKQLIHRDIKPSNLMRREADGKIFLIDFGTVKEIRISPVTTDANLPNNKLAGTASYQPRDGWDIPPSPPYDIYSVGIIGVQALTGINAAKFPLDPHTSEIIWRYKVKVSKNLEEILDNMLCHKKDHSKYPYQSVENVLNDLKKLKKSPPPTLKQVLGLWYVRLILVVFFPIIVPLGIRNLWLAQQAWSGASRGDELKESKQYKDAITSYENAIKNKPQSYQAWINRGFALGQLPQPKLEEKLNSCIAALEIQRISKENERDQEFLEALNCQGTALYSLGRIDEAIATYEKIIDIDPKHQHVLNNKGEALIAKFQKSGQKTLLEEAIKALNKEVDLYPGSLFGWTNKGKAHKLLGQYADSVKAYQQALKINPNYQPAIDGLKQVENQEKK